MNTKLQIALCTGALMMMSLPAFAQAPDDECQSDADCPDNFVCETIEWGACPGCEPGGECPPCETGSQNICTPPPPAKCDDATPCSGSDVCVTYTFEECNGGEARPSVPCSSEDPDDCGGSEDPVEPPECTSTEESYCVPPYLAPCSADADCGAGFTCENAEVCTCSGGGGTDAAPGPDEDPDMGSEDPPENPDCLCEPSDHTYCRLIEVECTSDSDCVGDLTCQDAYGGEDVPAGAPCFVDEDGNTDCGDSDPPEPVEPKSYCAPPGYGYYGAGVDGGGYGESVAEATGRDDATVTNSEREEFFPVDGTDGDGDKQSPSSCSTASGGSGGSLLLLLAGLLLGRRRRRF